MPTRRLTIFEGPDGSGKTTAARSYALRTGAAYVHFGPLFNVTTGVARMYVEAMLPALLGYQDVVFDRSWLSETPYGNAFRGGQDRIGYVGRRMLERLAMRCAAIIVRCNPGWEAVKASYETGREEMLTDVGQLRQVYDAYCCMETALPVIEYDYRTDFLISNIAADLRTEPHLIQTRSAGNQRAKIMLVGESFAERKNDDAWYQWPFASFSKQGCSWWLTEQLDIRGISEADLLWINSDDPSLYYSDHWADSDKKVIALGKEASAVLSKIHIDHTITRHPQYIKRFGGAGEYELFNLIQEQINNVKQPT